MRGARGALSRDDELTMEEGHNGSVSGSEEVGRIKETQGEGEERGGGGEGTKGRGLGKTVRGEKPSEGDAAVGLGESEVEEKKGE